MNPGEAPPIIGETVAPEPEPPPPVARWRWWVHLLVLTAFPLLAALAGSRVRGRATPMLPRSVRGLLLVSLVEMLFLGVLFGLAWLASRASPAQLLLKWRGGIRPVLWGIAYSIGLRLGIMLLLLVGTVFWLALNPGHAADLNRLKPQTEHLVDVATAFNNPIYFALILTLLSFVVAGFREELWRAAMLAGIHALFPRFFNHFAGRCAAVLVVAVLFGLGHAAQGPGGVLITAALGAGLGAIMLWHRSIWEAVLAHGFFDASTFVLLYLVTKYFPGRL